MSGILRLRAAACASILTSALALTSACAGGYAEARQGASPSAQQSAAAIIAGWPQASQKAAMMMIEKYGPPQEMTSSRLIWRNNGPWLWTRIDNYETPHDFPAPHTDVMEQAINYKFNPEMADELAAYDGSVYLRRTEGVISARCDLEGANFLALNLANDVNTGGKTVAQARDYYAKAMKGFKTSGEMDPYMTGLKFPVPARAPGDRDRAAM